MIAPNHGRVIMRHRRPNAKCYSPTPAGDAILSTGRRLQRVRPGHGVAMLDALIRRAIDPPLDRAGRWLAARGVRAPMP